MVATGTITIGYLGYLFPGTVGSWSIEVQGLLIIGFIVLSAVLALLRFRVTQNIVNVVLVLYGLAIARAITRYLFWGSLAVMAAYPVATWAVMVTVPAADGQSAPITALAEAVRLGLGGFWGDLVALILAGFFLFIAVVYSYSFARLIFVSGLDRRLPRVVGALLYLLGRRIEAAHRGGALPAAGSGS